jgi:UDP-N-acetylglucosamine 2-epimerase (non-hydrolysing)
MLVGTDQNQIVKNSQKLIDDKTHYESMSFSHNPYGDGTASEKITNVFQKSLI